MKQKIEKALLAGAIISTGLLSASQVEAKKTEKPNIIFILADDMGYGDVGFNGQTKIRTPFIDQMAKEGVVFNNHYSGSTVCGPSRACLMTGYHTGHCSVRELPRWTKTGKPVDLGLDDVTVAKELKRAGYTTGVIGKWGLSEGSWDGMPHNQGFDYFYGFRSHMKAHHYYPDSIWCNTKQFRIPGNIPKKKVEKYSHDLFTKEALNFIDKNSEKPFFLYLAYTIPHLEMTVPEESKEQYKKLGWPERKMKMGHYYNDPEGHTTYAGMVSRMDGDIGKILQLLKEKGVDENTLVVFTSDNGHEYDQVKKEFFNSNGPFRGHKRDLYEGGVHMPFVARWPGKIKENTTSEHISGFWDFLPTVCDLVGVKSTKKVDGISYLPALLGKEKKQKEHDYLYWEFNEARGPIQAILKGNWKAVRYYQSPIELYDLSKDQGEEHDVAEANPKMVKKMEKLFSVARTEHPDFPLIPNENVFKPGKREFVPKAKRNK